MAEFKGATAKEWFREMEESEPVNTAAFKTSRVFLFMVDSDSDYATSKRHSAFLWYAAKTNKPIILSVDSKVNLVDLDAFLAKFSARASARIVSDLSNPSRASLDSVATAVKTFMPV